MKRIPCIALSMLVAVSARAASFDCSKAATSIEKLVCRDAELSRLDEELSTAYKIALRDLTHADAIRQSQKEWVKERNICSAAAYVDSGTSVKCVKRFYEMQLSKLNLPIVTAPSSKLITERSDYSATLLPNGKVLIAGGSNGRNLLNSSELYEPATGRFVVAGNLVEGGSYVTALLPNGKVLFVGGETGEFIDGHGFVKELLNNAELYDSATGSAVVVGSLPGKDRYTATLLPNGKVLLVSGRSSELYDPATGLTATGKFMTERYDYTATLLPGGKVLFAGGRDSGNRYIDTAELYDPVVGAFVATGSLSQVRIGQTATLLPNGKVLVAGGKFEGTYLASAELYDPATGHFTKTGKLVTERSGHIATLLRNGKVLIAEGLGGADGYLTSHSLELYDPATGTFSAVGRLAGGQRTATLLQNGNVLFVGGNTAEVYVGDRK